MASSVTILGYFITLLLCVCLSAGRFLEPSRRLNSFNIFKRAPGQSLKDRLTFRSKLSPTTEVLLHSNVELSCQVGGRPSPTIHWLKDGHRIEQGEVLDSTNDEAYYEDTMDETGRPLIRLSYTKSVLYLDCVTPEMEGIYECVADTTEEKKTSKTILKIVTLPSYFLEEAGSCMTKRSTDFPARQYLWTINRIEKSGAAVQIFCRAEGSPRPKNTWLDNKGEEITDNPNYEVLPNGDLLIHNLQWSHMGRFTCISENDSGRDTHRTFVYPARSNDK